MDELGGPRGLTRRRREPFRPARGRARLDRVAPRLGAERRQVRRRARRRSRASRRPPRCRTRRSRVVVFRAEETGPMGSKRLGRAAGRVPRAAHRARAPCSSVRESRSESSRRSPARLAAWSSSRVAPITRGRRRWTCATTRSSKAARFVLHVQECARDGAVATVGAVEVEPNAMNVVPARVTVAVDARAPTVGAARRARRGDRLRAGRRASIPVAMSGAPFETLSALLPDAPTLVSGAGHVRAWSSRRRACRPECSSCVA